MKKKLKSALALLLSLLCLLPMLSLAGFAATPTYDVDYPVVYIAGKFTTIYDKDLTKYDNEDEVAAHQIYPLKTPLADKIKDKKVVNDIVLAYNISNLTGNWKIFADKVYGIVEPMYRDLVLDGNGDITNGSHIKPVPKPVARLGGYGLSTYMFTYDSRLDPYENAEMLKDYINEVLRITGKTKVNLIGRCLGTTLVSTYLTEYGCSKVETAIFYASAFNGVQMMDDFFTGNIEFNAKQIQYYLDYGKITSSESYAIINNAWNIFNALGFTGSGVNTANKVWKKTAPYLHARLVRAIFGTWPGHWAMISADSYEAAKKAVFGDCMDQYAGLIKKLDRYQKNVMSVWPQTLKNMVEKEGLRIAIFSKYNTPLTPLSPEDSQQADGTVELETMSLGAKSAPIGETYSAEEIRELKNRGRGRYLSPDNRVDATDCMFPDYTWFIRDVAHDAYPKTINRLFMDIFHSKTQVTVWNNTRGIPQFVAFNKNDGLIYRILGPNSLQAIPDNEDDLEETLPPDPVYWHETEKVHKNVFNYVADWIVDFVTKIMNLFGMNRK